MARRRELQHRIESLAEIRDIMNSMKTLAYMETRKLSHFLDAQQAVVSSMEAVAADLLAFYPEVLPESGDADGVYLLIGSERGFCGEFNQALMKRFAEVRESAGTMLVTVGSKLASLMGQDHRIDAAIDGAGIAEEVETVLDRLIRELAALQSSGRLTNLFSVHHQGDDGIAVRRLLPPFQRETPAQPAASHPPLLLQPPAEYLLALTDHYLFATLHELLYTSLMEESRQRVAHLDGAVQHLDEQSARLHRRYNAMRQEEIIEEIEVILLGPANSTNA